MVARHNYSEKVAARICQLVADGETLNSIARMKNMPPRRSMRDWLASFPEFERRYAIARAERIDGMVDGIMTICERVAGSANVAEVAAARLAVDSIKWLASKSLPHKFGDRVEHVGADGQALIPPETDRSKVALVLLSILKNARPELEVIEEAEVLEHAPSTEPRRLLLSDEPRDEALLVVEPVPPPPSPRWTSDGRGQTRHVSEQRDLFPVRVVK